jgi:hypothetical protein
MRYTYQVRGKHHPSSSRTYFRERATVIRTTPQKMVKVHGQNIIFQGVARVHAPNVCTERTMHVFLRPCRAMQQAHIWRRVRCSRWRQLLTELRSCARWRRAVDVLSQPSDDPILRAEPIVYIENFPMVAAMMNAWRINACGRNHTNLTELNSRFSRSVLVLWVVVPT